MLTPQEKKELTPLIAKAVEAKDVLEDAERALMRVVDRLRRIKEVPPDAVFDAYRLCFCVKNATTGRLDPL